MFRLLLLSRWNQAVRPLTGYDLLQAQRSPGQEDASDACWAGLCDRSPPAGSPHWHRLCDL